MLPATVNIIRPWIKMTIEDQDTIDFISTKESSGEVFLSISDHLEWKDGDIEHLLLLQEKINAYLKFIESGEIYESYPNAKGKKISISIITQYSLSHDAVEFIDKVHSVLADSGIGLKHESFS